METPYESTAQYQTDDQSDGYCCDTECYLYGLHCDERPDFCITTAGYNEHVSYNTNLLDMFLFLIMLYCAHYTILIQCVSCNQLFWLESAPRRTESTTCGELAEDLF